MRHSTVCYQALTVTTGKGRSTLPYNQHNLAFRLKISALTNNWHALREEIGTNRRIPHIPKKFYILIHPAPTVDALIGKISHSQVSVPHNSKRACPWGEGCRGGGRGPRNSERPPLPWHLPAGKSRIEKAKGNMAHPEPTGR